MGTPTDRPLKVNPKKGPGGGQLACADELAAFLACMMVRARESERCDGGGASDPAPSSSLRLPLSLSLLLSISSPPDLPHGRRGRVRGPAESPGCLRGGGGESWKMGREVMGSWMDGKGEREHGRL